MMRIDEAVLEDNSDLQTLQSKCPMGIGLKVRNVNSPDFFARSRAYESKKVLVVRENDLIIGSGAVAVKPVQIGGEERMVGYDFQYFISREGRRAGVASTLLKWSEAYLLGLGVELSYCLIIAGNRPALGLVQNAGFKVERDLIMAGLPIYKLMSPPVRGTVREMRPHEFPEIAELIQSTWSGHDFRENCTAASLEDFSRRAFGEGKGGFLVLEQAGRIQACLGRWDWSRIMSVTVLSLSLKYRLMGAALSAGKWFAPLPSIPRPGEKLRQWLVTHMGFRDPESGRILLQHLNNAALQENIGQVFSLFEPSPRMDALFKGFFRVDTIIHLAVKGLRGGKGPRLGKVHPAGFDL